MYISIYVCSRHQTKLQRAPGPPGAGALDALDSFGNRPRDLAEERRQNPFAQVIRGARRFHWLKRIWFKFPPRFEESLSLLEMGFEGGTGLLLGNVFHFCLLWLLRGKSHGTAIFFLLSFQRQPRVGHAVSCLVTPYFTLSGTNFGLFRNIFLYAVSLILTLGFGMGALCSGFQGLRIGIGQPSILNS